MSKRRRVLMLRVLLLAVLMLIWLGVLFVASMEIASRRARVISWSNDQKPMTYPDRFYVLLFPKPTASNCEVTAHLNRAVIERFDRVERSEIEVYVDNMPLNVDASCMTLFPPDGQLQTLVDNLVAQFRIWGSEITDWTSASAIERPLADDRREIQFTLNTENGLQTFIYETDGTHVAPIRTEALSGAAVGLMSTALFFMLILAHIVGACGIAAVWLLRKWRLAVIGSRM